MDKKENQKEGNGKFENFSEELGARLSQLREQKGWTQEDMAEKIGKCPQTVYRYEYGLTEVPAKILSKYAKLFQVSADFLFYGDNAENRASSRFDSELPAGVVENLLLNNRNGRKK